MRRGLRAGECARERVNAKYDACKSVIARFIVKLKDARKERDESILKVLRRYGY